MMRPFLAVQQLKILLLMQEHMFDSLSQMIPHAAGQLGSCNTTMKPVI